MTTDVRFNNTDMSVAEQQSIQSSGIDTNKTAPNSINEGKGSENTDTYTKTDSAKSTRTQAKRTTDELANKLFKLKQLYGFNSSEITEILEKVSGSGEAALINAEESEINKIINIINSAVDILKDKNIEINSETIIDMSKNIKIRIDNDWSLEGAIKDIKNNPSQESLADKLRRVWPGIFTEDFDFSAPEKREIIKQKIIDYVELYHKNEKLGNQDWAKMLANSKNDNERDVFDSILTEIDPEYRAKFIKSWLYSYDSEENRADAAERTGKRIYEVTEGMSVDDRKDTSFAVRRVQNEKGVTVTDTVIYNEANKFFQEKNISVILEKVKNKEELTPEEKTALEEWNNKYKAVIEGSITGTCANDIISDMFKNEHLQTFVNPQIFAYGENEYRDILTGICELSDKYKNEYNINTEEFTRLMDKATNGNYSTVIEGKKNELTPPTTAESVNEPAVKNTQNTANENVSNQETTTELASKNRKAPSQEDFERVNEKKEAIYNTDFVNGVENANSETTAGYTTNKTSGLMKSIKLGVNCVKAYAHHNKISNEEISAVILNTANVIQSVKEYALDLFDKFTNPVKKLVFEKRLKSNEGKIAAAKYMDVKQLASLNNSSSSYVQKSIDNIIEEKEKKNTRSNLYNTCSDNVLMS